MLIADNLKQGQKAKIFEKKKKSVLGNLLIDVKMSNSHL